MKDDDQQEIHFIETLLNTYTKGLQVFQKDGLLPKINMVQNQIGQEIIPMHFHELSGTRIITHCKSRQFGKI